MLIVLQRHRVHQLSLGEQFGRVAALGQEHGERVRHIALLHQVRNERHANLVRKPVVDVLKVKCGLATWLIILQLQLLIEPMAQL